MDDSTIQRCLFLLSISLISPPPYVSLPVLYSKLEKSGQIMTCHYTWKGGPSIAQANPFVHDLGSQNSAEALVTDYSKIQIRAMTFFHYLIL